MRRLDGGGVRSSPPKRRMGDQILLDMARYSFALVGSAGASGEGVSGRRRAIHLCAVASKDGQVGVSEARVAAALQQGHYVHLMYVQTCSTEF